MEKKIDKIVDIWKKAYAESLPEKKAYQSTEQLRQIAAIFSPGRTFFYILNLQDMTLEYVSEEVEEFTGFSKDDATIFNMMSTATDLPLVQKKEKVIQDFVINHTQGNELLNYKFIYTHRMKKANGSPRTMLLQSAPLTIFNGVLQHVLAIHTDVTHLKIPESNTISIVHLKGGISYYNLEIEKGVFDPSTATLRDLNSPTLTGREKEIVQLMAKGLNAEQVAEALSISIHTVRTHRKNLLKKHDCANATELVAQCLAAGMIGV